MTLEVEIVRIPVNAARVLELIQALKGARTGYLAAPACQAVSLLVTQASDEIAVILTWSSAQAHAEAVKTEQAASFFKAVSTLSSARPEVRAYLPAGVEGA
ncbi:MAG: hypothetical protein WB646_11820 [Steroidobacteraceae bacterium]